jgi:hypothetical protein
MSNPLRLYGVTSAAELLYELSPNPTVDTVECPNTHMGSSAINDCDGIARLEHANSF